MKYIPLLKALFKGRSLLNAAAWKNIQMVATLLSGIAFSILQFFPDFTVDSQVIDYIVTGIAYIGAGVSLYLTPATTEKIGLPNNEINTDFTSGVDDGELFMGDEAGNVQGYTDRPNTRGRGLHNGF